MTVIQRFTSFASNALAAAKGSVLVGGVVPKPLLFTHGVSHAAARFCETLPSEPDTPVRMALILLRLGVQNPAHVFLDDQLRLAKIHICAY